MIPPKTHPKWSSIVKGDAKIKFSVFAGNMLLGQCQRKLARDDSAATLSACIDEAHAFFTKYENIYGGELAKAF